MLAWNSSKTKELDIGGKQSGTRCFSGMYIANQLFQYLFDSDLVCLLQLSAYDLR